MVGFHQRIQPNDGLSGSWQFPQPVPIKIMGGPVNSFFPWKIRFIEAIWLNFSSLYSLNQAVSLV